MPDSDLEIAQQFQSAAEETFRTGETAPLVALLAADVECVTPQRSVQGVDALVEELSRARPSDRFDVDFEGGEWKSLGKGRYACEIRVLFQSKVADNLSYHRNRRFELTVEDGKVSRYAMRFAD
jgi:hypothetical protein